MILIAALISILCVGALAQQNPDQAPVFRSQVNTVLVPVVVRDAHGRAVGHLTRDDFEVFDKGNRQAITSFSAIERAKPFAARVSSGPGNHARDATVAGVAATSSDDQPARYFIYLFDDLNIRFADMANVRAAAIHHFKNNLRAGDRAAIYAASGNPTLELTDNREQLESAVAKLRWRVTVGSGMHCPDVSYYIADLIMVKGDAQALAALTNHTALCAHVRPEVARMIALAAANQELLFGAQIGQATLRTLRRAIRRLSGAPGQRVIVLASPGFFSQTPEAIKAAAEVLDLAAKSDVIINALSARGVILAEEEQDVTGKTGAGRRAPPSQSAPDQLWIRYRREGARADGDVLQELAEGTGGIFFHNNNDLRAGLERTTAVPEFSYVLGFSPTQLDEDGRFHVLKIRLPNRKGVSIEGRRGYYGVPRSAKDSAAIAELDEAVFSGDQRTDIPVVLMTSSSKPNNSERAKLLIVAKIDLALLNYRPADDRTGDRLNVVVAVFDADGGYVTGASEAVSSKLFDEAVRKSEPALTLRCEFPGMREGDYTLRLVVRQPETSAMTKINRALTL